jgi:hypothetical protein
MSAPNQSPLIAVLFALLLSGCSGDTFMYVKPEKLVGCTPQIDFARPGDVSNDDPHADGSLRIDSNPKQQTPFEQRCVEEKGEKLAYGVFALKRGQGPYTLLIESNISGNVWGPKVKLYDKNFQQTREIPASQFQMQSDESHFITTSASNWLDLKLPLREEEKYAVLLTDADMLGRSASGMGLGTREVQVTRWKTKEECSGSGAQRRCKSRQVQETDYETEVFSTIINYRYTQGGRITIQTRRTS